MAIFTILKYGLSSIFNFKYFFAPLKAPNPNSPTAIRAPKIYDEPPKLEEAQQNVEENAQQSQVPTQIPEQNIQAQQEMNIQQNKEVIQQEKQIQDIQANAQTEVNPIKDQQKEIQKVPEQQKEKIITQKKEQKVQITQKEVKTQNIINQNISSSQTQSKVVKKKGGHPVFKTQGQMLDYEGALVQYYLENENEIVIGLENRTNEKFRLQLTIYGAIIANTGKSIAVFYSNPRERKIFKAKRLNKKGEISFQFDYV